MHDPVSAYHWLKRGDDEYINFTLHNLISRLQAEIEAGQLSAALECLEQLEIASQGADRLEQAWVRLECALAACQIHDPSLATAHLNTALELLGPGAGRSRIYAHTFAVASWLLGLLTMPLSGPAHAAATAWQNSLQAFEFLGVEPGLSASAQGWYQDRRAEMQQAIAGALAGRSPGPARQHVTLLSGRLNAIDVFKDISNPVEKLHLQPAQEEFRIANWPYRLYSLRGPRRMLALDSARQYRAVQVSGNWMDRIGVDPGDYLLLCHQEQAESGDVVLVQVFNADPSARVYHLHRKMDVTILSPQSTNSEHPTFEFGPGEGDRYHVYGVVIGVFKPSSPEPQPSPEEQAAAEQEAEGAPIPVEDFLQTFPIYSDIPAGGPQAVPTFTGRYVELDRFMIDDRPYTIKNLRGKGSKINPRSGKLIFLRVSGSSMNDPEKADIQNGDYVLLRWQDSASDGDIVAAEIRGVDTRATLKRYRERNGEIRLVPESTDPEFQEPIFSRIYTKDDLENSGTEQPFYIKGVALAVFKPYPDSQQ